MRPAYPTRDLRNPLAIAAPLLVALATTGITPAPLRAGEPPLPIISVDPWDSLQGMFVAPDSPGPIPGTTAHIVIHNSEDDPIPDASVVIELTPANPACPGAVLIGITDSQGEVDITVAAGGCAHQIPLSGVIKANGVTIRAYDSVKSPDYDGAGADGSVDLRDLAAFSGEFLHHLPSMCHDYDNDGNTGLSDLILFTPAFLGAIHCP